MNLSRRRFLRGLAMAGGIPSIGPLARPRGMSLWDRVEAGEQVAPAGRLSTSGSDDFPWEAVGRQLTATFPDLRRHFVFEYYPWYATDPFRHWQQWGREPPLDVAAACMPGLGAYDSRATPIIEQHARWIAESGVGVVNLSWWRPGSFSDRAIHGVMDVMRDHDIRVAFHLEPYGPERVDWLPADIRYLISEYGEKRHWDCFFLHERADGRRGPVFKMFATIVPERIVDCRGQSQEVALHVSPGRWRRALDQIRAEHAGQFDLVTLLSDAADAAAVRDAGFDGFAIYDPTLEPETWLGHAVAATRMDLVFSFNSNPGVDEITRRKVPPGSCYQPRPFLPRTSPIDWTRAEDRGRAVELAIGRMTDTLQWSLLLQTHPWLGNVNAGFFLVYLTSFNEWHEGTQFEPMRDRARLTSAERAVGYHNTDDGAYRLETLKTLLACLS